MGSSTKVVPTKASTDQTVQLPQYLQDAGQAAVAKATTMSTTPYTPYTGELVAGISGNQGQAITQAQTDANAGQGSNAIAQGALGAAGVTAANDTGSGTGALDAASSLYNTASNQALNSQMAGMDSNADQKTLSDAAGTSALTAANAGDADLDAARSYNAASTAPITGDQIASYFNPYVQQAIDPVVAQLQKAAGQNKSAIDMKSAMTGSFGGSRSGLEEAQNQSDLLNQIATTTGAGYLNAYNNAQTMATDALGRDATAANTSINTANAANSGANDAVSRLTSAAGAEGTTGTTASDLATAAQNRTVQAAQGQTSLGQAQSQLSTDDVNRLLSLITPANQTATTESSLDNDSLNRLLTTGQVQQTEQQNVDNANYQQAQNQINWPQQQLNALLAAAGGVPYGTSTTSNSTGEDVIQSPSVLGQILGGVGAAAGAFAASNRDFKEDFSDVDDEDILQRIARLPVEEYRYRKEVQPLIGDDGRKRIGPMADDWSKEFGGNGKIIPMPEILGALVSAVKALDKRTAVNDEGDGGALAA